MPIDETEETEIPEETVDLSETEFAERIKGEIEEALVFPKQRPSRFKGVLRHRGARIVRWAAAILAAAIAVTVLKWGYDAGRERGLEEDFSLFPAGRCFPEGTMFGPWLSQFNSFGCNEVGTLDGYPYLHLTPRSPKGAEDTGASLVTGPGYRGDLVFQAALRTQRQLRTAAPPHEWEAAWLLWDYTDNAHFYYFIPKPLGWELGKRDPAYRGGQRFLATGENPFPIGSWSTVRIMQRGNAITIFVNRQAIVSYIDRERPYTHGKIGFYSEDAETYFGDVWASGVPDDGFSALLALAFPRREEIVQP